jgi:stalled ribosome rescue protein Dom34
LATLFQKRSAVNTIVVEKLVIVVFIIRNYELQFRLKESRRMVLRKAKQIEESGKVGCSFVRQDKHAYDLVCVIILLVGSDTGNGYSQK